MALPALLTAGKALLGGAGKDLLKGGVKKITKGAITKTGKDAGKNLVKSKKTTIKKDRLLGKKSGALVKSYGSSALVPISASPGAIQKVDSKGSGESGLLSEVIVINKTTVKIKQLLATNLAQQKAAADAERKANEKAKKRSREEELESQKPTAKSSKPGIKDPGGSIFDKIKNFFLFTLLGMLAQFLLRNEDKILKILDFISKNLSASIKILLATLKILKVAPLKILKGIAKLGFKLFVSGPLGLIGKVIKKSAGVIFNTFKAAGKAFFKFLKTAILGALKLIQELGKQVAKTAVKVGSELVKRGKQLIEFAARVSRAFTGALKGGQGLKGAAGAVVKSAKRSLTKTLTKEAAKKAAQKAGQEVIEKAGQEVVEQAGKKLAQKGVEQAAKKVASKGLASRIPVIGPLITAAVSLLSGEPVGQALFKAGGAALGGFLGSFIPIPVLGTLIGELIGEYVGDLAYVAISGGGIDAVGKKLQSDLTAAMSVGNAAIKWIGDGFSRLSEGIPKLFGGVPNFVWLLNPTNSAPLFWKSFFTRDKMSEKKVEQKMFGGFIGEVKDAFSGIFSAGPTKGPATASVSTSGRPKDPFKLKDIEISNIPLKDGKKFIGITASEDALEGIGGLFGGGLGDALGLSRNNPSGSGVQTVQSGPSNYSAASYKEDPEFEKEVNRLAQKYDIDATDLLGLMASESGLNPQARNKSGATGLIQFMPTTARSLGTSTAALYKMNRVQQMKYVEKYFDYWKLPKGATPGHLYTSVFLPAFTNKPADYIVARRGGFRDSWGHHPASWYTHNAGLDSNGDGSISIAELGARIQKKKKEFGITGGGKAPVIAKEPVTTETEVAVSPEVKQKTKQKKENESEYDTSKHGKPGGPKIGKGFNAGKGDTNRKIFLHWSAGDYNTPYNNYHTTFLGDGTPVRTTANYGIDKNNHTGGANTGSVGLAIAAMASGQEHNFGSYPPKESQLQAMALEAGSLAKAWGWSESTIDKNVMTHGEWERYATKTGKLPGSPQRWDLDKVFSPKEKIGAGGDYMRKLIKNYFKGINDGKVEPPVEGKTIESDSPSGDSTPPAQIAQDQGQDTGPSIEVDWSKNKAIIGDYRADGKNPYGGGVGSARGSVRKSKMTMGVNSPKSYNIKESAYYDDPTSQPIIVPIPQINQKSMNSAPRPINIQTSGVAPMMMLNRDINSILMEVALY